MEIGPYQLIKIVSAGKLRENDIVNMRLSCTYFNDLVVSTSLKILKNSPLPALPPNIFNKITRGMCPHDIIHLYKLYPKLRPMIHASPRDRYCENISYPYGFSLPIYRMKTRNKEISNIHIRVPTFSSRYGTISYSGILCYDRVFEICPQLKNCTRLRSGCEHCKHSQYFDMNSQPIQFNPDVPLFVEMGPLLTVCRIKYSHSNRSDLRSS